MDSAFWRLVWALSGVPEKVKKQMFNISLAEYDLYKDVESIMNIVTVPVINKYAILC